MCQVNGVAAEFQAGALAAKLRARAMPESASCPSFLPTFSYYFLRAGLTRRSQHLNTDSGQGIDQLPNNTLCHGVAGGKACFQSDGIVHDGVL